MKPTTRFPAHLHNKLFKSVSRKITARIRPRTTSPPLLRLTAENIYLRPPTHADCSQWISVRSHNQKMLAPYEPTWPKDALTETFYFRRLKRQAREWYEDRAYPFLIFHRHDRRLLGGININHVCRGAAQQATIGYWLDQDFQGRGLMAEALGRLIPFAFISLRLHRLNAAILPHNTRSARLLERSEFRKEGYVHSYIKINGNWEDHILYGLPVELWRRQVREHKY